jgi:hypothetical protein
MAGIVVNLKSGSSEKVGGCNPSRPKAENDWTNPTTPFPKSLSNKRPPLVKIPATCARPKPLKHLNGSYKDRESARNPCRNEKDIIVARTTGLYTLVKSPNAKHALLMNHCRTQNRESYRTPRCCLYTEEVFIPYF